MSAAIRRYRRSPDWDYSRGASLFVTIATAFELGETLLSGNKKHFKEVPLLDARAFRASDGS